MKKVIRFCLMVLSVISLLAGLFTAYAEMSKQGDSSRGEGYDNPVYHHFYLTLKHGGITDTATDREKVIANAYASYALTTVTNTTGYSLYVNVRNQAGTAPVGYAHSISYGVSVPPPFNVYYYAGFGTVTYYYRPSGQTSINATVGGYIEGDWLP
ncbi:MAG: hypothetical protein II885_18235 [Oscillospiraceae bacterium]|nr:hypothetical protein [Oscillospiraceae bacterium]